MSITGSLQDSTELAGAKGVRLSGSYLYIACGSRRSLAVVDVSTPSSPTLAGTYRHTSYLNNVQDVALDPGGSYAYMAVYNSDRVTVHSTPNLDRHRPDS